MRIGERSAAVLLSEEGREVLTLAAVDVAESPFLSVYVEDTDDMGLWGRVAREDGDHLVLIRWDYVLSIDFPAGEPKTIGLK